MNFDTQTIAKCALGFFLSIPIGLLFRYLFFRILLLVSAPIVAMLILDYTNIYSIDWLFLEAKGDTLFASLTPTVTRMYSYLGNHSLMGFIPGILIGLASGFFFLRR